MSTPNPDQISSHERAHGGLWRAIPKATRDVQPQPVFMLLRMVRGKVVVNHGGELPDVVHESALEGAEWVACTARGDRV